MIGVIVIQCLRISPVICLDVLAAYWRILTALTPNILSRYVRILSQGDVTCGTIAIARLGLGSWAPLTECVDQTLDAQCAVVTVSSAACNSIVLASYTDTIGHIPHTIAAHT